MNSTRLMYLSFVGRPRRRRNDCDGGCRRLILWDRLPVRGNKVRLEKVLGLDFLRFSLRSSSNRR
jgi:hypothetical protein